MNTSFLRLIFSVVLAVVFAGCANIVPPTGGKKDVIPPKLIEVKPGDSLKNTKVSRIEMKFDEFVTVENAGKEILVSPVIPFPLNTTVVGKRVIVKIPDTLLLDNTTYRVSFGNAIKDLHEGNVFKGYSYIFSTGGYFDSMRLAGKVTDAETGLPAGDVTVLLYDAFDSDSAVVKKKPVYFVKTAGNGTFDMSGLPARSFRLYALKDENDNLVYDGEKEKIAFVDSLVIPRDSIVHPEQLRLFKEIIPVDSSLILEEEKSKGTGFRSRFKDNDKNRELRYGVSVDTANKEKRTYDINKEIRIRFSEAIDTFDVSKVFLSYDSSDIEVEAAFELKRDTTVDVLLLNTDWKENTLYTLRLLKDFATDTSGSKATPSKYIFRTMSDDDYGKLHIHLPGKYLDSTYILMVYGEKDTVHKQAVTDTTVHISRLSPGDYHIRIIIDENKNGKWDTGDLFEGKQPEYVIPYNSKIQLKAGWENVIDFVEPVTEPENAEKSPPKREKPRRN